MNVLREGGTHKVSCSNCKSLLEIDASDIKIDDCGVLHHHWTSKNQVDCWVNCPVCCSIIPMVLDNLPRNIFRQVFE